MHRLGDNQTSVSAKYNVKFMDQTLLDLAAVSDLNRPIVIETDNGSGSVKEIHVLVSSYQLGVSDTLSHLLNQVRSRQKLRKKIRRVKVSVGWLQSNCRPEIATWLSESLFGATMQSIPGCAGGASPLALSFSGRPKRDGTMVPLPKRHKSPIFSHEDYDMFNNVTNTLLQSMKKEAIAFGGTYMSPPPTNETQIVKLKWSPSNKAKHIDSCDCHGSWRGAYAVKTGESNSVILQECGLPREWVEENFALLLRRECQDIALQLKGNHNPKKYLLIPAGDKHDIIADPPPANEVMTTSVRFQQGNEDTCLRDSLASALHTFGFDQQANDLGANCLLAGCNLSLVGDVSAVLRKLFAKENLQLVKLFPHACSVLQVQACDTEWPIVLVLMTNIGQYGTHAVTVWKGEIYDSNLPFTL